MKEKVNIKSNNIIIFVHVSKCGGSSLGNMMKRGKKKYNLALVKPSLVIEKTILRNQNQFILPPKKIKHKPSVIMGHFHYSTYLSLYPNAKLLTIIRDPVERTISHYFHGIGNNKFFKKKSSKYLEDEFRKMREDPIYFTKCVGNYMTRCFTGHDPKIFDFIGFTENHKESLEYINKHYFPIMDIEQKRHFRSKKKIEKMYNIKESDVFTEKIKQEMKNYLQRDYKFYYEAKELFSNEK